jgi:hypothetical protein
MRFPEEDAMHLLDVPNVEVLLNQLYRFVTETDSEYGYLFLTVGLCCLVFHFCPVNYRIFSLCAVPSLMCYVYLEQSLAAFYEVKFRRVRRCFVDGLRNFRPSVIILNNFVYRNILKVIELFVACGIPGCRFLVKTVCVVGNLFTALVFSMENNEERYDYLQQKVWSL